jgi:hypothetical protein
MSLETVILPLREDSAASPSAVLTGLGIWRSTFSWRTMQIDTLGRVQHSGFRLSLPRLITSLRAYGESSVLAMAQHR